MKKYMKFLSIALCILLCGCVLVACGKKDEAPAELKPADIVGEWYVESAVYTYNGSTDTSTFARFMELHNKADKTADEEDEYLDLETVILKFNVTSEGELQYKQYFADSSEYTAAGTWAIEDGKLTANVTFVAGETAVEYKDGKIIVTSSRMWLEKLETQVMTLVKVV
ncbi:MAG: hypothetical protein J6X00_03690 [Clostridia bacterium]|nr:hypothetical protein [Clostridia bacterium]